MTHPDITLDVEGRGPCEPEGLHVGVDDSLVHGVPLSPGPLELGYQLVVHRAPRMTMKYFSNNLSLSVPTRGGRSAGSSCSPRCERSSR